MMFIPQRKLGPHLQAHSEHEDFQVSLSLYTISRPVCARSKPNEKRMKRV